MDSDSDSDGSHVSATPPRESNPPSPPAPLSVPPLQPSPIFFTSHKSRIRSKNCSSSTSEPVSKLRKSLPRSAKNCATDPKPKPEPLREAIHEHQFSLPELPFQILRSCDQIPATVRDCIENLPAGFFSKSASFSKSRGSLLNLEPSQSELSPSSRSNTLQCKVEKEKCDPGEFVDFTKEGGTMKSSIGFTKRNLNLIGANAPMPPTKLRKCGAEGNFVKLNLKGKRRKFVNKFNRKRFQYASGSHRGYRKSRRKWKKEGDENDGVCEEDGLVVETSTQRQRGAGERIESTCCRSIEEAVLAARETPSEENLENLLKLVFGYDSFRDGQMEAIQLLLSGKSAMLVLPTGAGKSLCYQLPAIVLPGITLVVSPLVALMIDQLKQLPPMISGGLLCSSQTPDEVSETIKQLQEGKLKVLFVSPERFLNPGFLSIISAVSVISLVVIDEAHCISEWSHNFRPSFMRLRSSFFRTRLKVGSILAMTATVTTTTLDAVMSALDIPLTNLIKKVHLRENVQMSVSLTSNRMKDLLHLVKAPPFIDAQSIIIYCKFQYEADLLSGFLCDNNISTKSYHSGIPTKERSRVQELFCTNKIKAVVATVAFGMGLDKKDVGAVIHYSLPESLEEYVQEIGRAGRDGRLSYCHLFYDDDTYFKLRSLMHSDGVDAYAVNKFLCQVFSFDHDARGKTCSLVKESASRMFDMKDEVILTLLTHLELGDVQYLRLLPQQNVTCSLNFHKTTPSLLAEKNSVVSAILKRSEIKNGKYEFDLPTVANSTGIATTDLSNQLQNLKLMGEITYELKDQAFCYTPIKIPTDILSLSEQLTRWLLEVENCKVRKLDALFDAVCYALNKCDKMHGCSGSQHTQCLQKKISDYFDEVDSCGFLKKTVQSSPFLRADIKVFLQSNSHNKFTPRAIARIMHGIASPSYPSSIWGGTHFWGRYVQTDFHSVMEAAKAELMNFIGKEVL